MDNIQERGDHSETQIDDDIYAEMLSPPAHEQTCTDKPDEK
jgi:hypothetical protein